MKKIVSGMLLLFAASFTAQAATTDTISIASERLDTPMKVTVITPDAARTAPQAQFPTVYLLNGYGGDHTSWTSLQPRLGELADRYGMVMVMPDGRDSWYWDAPHNPKMQMETFIVKELVPYIDSHYPTKADASKRAITGLSMGGHGALRLAILHDDVFGSAGSTSGGVDIRPFAKRWKMAQILGERDENPQLWDGMTVATLVPQMKGKNLNIIFDCGVSDFFAGVNDDFHKALVEAGVPHDYISRPGNHSQAYWRNAILYQLLYFNEVFTH